MKRWNSDQINAEMIGSYQSGAQHSNGEIISGMNKNVMDEWRFSFEQKSIN